VIRRIPAVIQQHQNALRASAVSRHRWSTLCAVALTVRSASLRRVRLLLFQTGISLTRQSELAAKKDPGAGLERWAKKRSMVL
jgi:hypothetical protein